MPGHPHPYRLVWNEGSRWTELRCYDDTRQAYWTVFKITDEFVASVSPEGLAIGLGKIAELLEHVGQKMIWVEHPQGVDFGSEPLATPTALPRSWGPAYDPY